MVGLTIWVHFLIGVGYCVIIVSRPKLGHAQLSLYFVARTVYSGTKWTELESDQFPLPNDELKSVNNYYPYPMCIHCLVHFCKPRQVLYLAVDSLFKLFK